MVGNTDLYALDSSLDYNGSHSFLKKHPEFSVTPATASELLKLLKNKETV